MEDFIHELIISSFLSGELVEDAANYYRGWHDFFTFINWLKALSESIISLIFRL